MSSMFDPFTSRMKESTYQEFLRTNGYKIARYKYGPALDIYLEQQNRQIQDSQSLGRLIPPARPNPVLSEQDIHRGGTASQVYGPQPPAPTPQPVVEPELTPQEKRHAMLSQFSNDLRQAPSQLEQVRTRRRQLGDPTASDYEPVRNNDRGWSRLGSVAREFVVQVGKAYQDADPRLKPTERLAGSLGAGLAGGAYEATIGTADEQRNRTATLARLGIREQELLAQQQADQSALTYQIKTAKDLQDLQINQPVEVIDPATGKKMLVKSSEAFGQGNALLRQQTGIDATNQRDTLNRRSRETQGELNRENAMSVARATAQTSSDRFNIGNQIDAESEYVKRKDAWLVRRQNTASEIAKAAASVGANAGVANQYISNINKNIEMARAIQMQADAETNPKKKAQYEQSVADYMKRIDADTIKMQLEVGRTQQGAALIKQLGSQDDRPPQRRAVPTLKPTLPQGRKPVSSNRDPLGLFSR